MIGRNGGRGSGISVLAARHDDDDDDDEVNNNNNSSSNNDNNNNNNNNNNNKKENLQNSRLCCPGWPQNKTECEKKDKYLDLARESKKNYETRRWQLYQS